MRTWAFVSQKGGSGKSTLSTQMAVYAEECGEAVLLVDLDPQASSMAWSKIRDSREPLVVAAKTPDIPNLIKQAPSFGATLCIIDTPPHTNDAALAAIRAADLIICPTQPSLFDVSALRDTVELLDLSKSRHKAIAVLNGMPSQGADAVYEEAARAIEGIGLKLAPKHIGHRRPFVEAIGKGKGVTEVAKGNKAADEIRSLWSDLNGRNPIVITKRESAK